MSMIAGIVLKKLESLLVEEFQSLGGVRAGINELRDDLEIMKAFLQDAEARSEFDNGVKTWVKQVRDIAYDTEDVIEDFILRLSQNRSNGYFLGRFSRYIRTLKQRHRLATQIKRLRVRIRAISERRIAFPFSRDRVNESTWHDPRLASLFIDEADVVGIETPQSLLVSWLSEGDHKLTAITVVGMGGLGKTTLVKKAYDSRSIKKHFDCHSWVTVSKSFSPAEVLRAALKGFLEATKESYPEGIDTLFQLVEVLRFHLQQKRYVIVFDDVWKLPAWELVKYAFPDSNNGSRIIFTTRLANIAQSLEINCHIYYLQPLKQEEAWALFCKKAFRGECNGFCPKELEQMSLSILKKCGGLPLAIVAIGSLLSTKKNSLLEWKVVCENLALEMNAESNLESLGKILLLSYSDLPYNLKQCFLYLSVFPEDYLIKRMKAIRLWVVERFVEQEGRSSSTMEEEAEHYLNELANRSMIQVVQLDHFNRVRTFRVHDLMRELIQKKAREESLATIVEERTETESEKVRRVAIHNKSENPSGEIKYPCLRSLLVFSWNGYSPSFYGFRLLRVLELEYAPLSKFPVELVELILLRYLSLRRTYIKSLPESIGKLKNLEILDLKGTQVSSIPIGVLQLQKLCQLRKYHCRFESSSYVPETYGMKLPQGIGKLTSLQKLGSIEVNGDADIVRELGNLNQLRRLGILKLRGEDGIHLCSSLEKLKHLTGFFMVSSSTNEIVDLDALLSPPQFLQRLYLKCGLSTLPKWINSLQLLSKLVLQHSSLKTDPLKALQDLPNLAVLELRWAYEGSQLFCDSRGYQKLKKLVLLKLERLECVTIQEGAMAGLKELEIISCSVLKMVPLGVEYLRNLKDLLLWDMPNRFLKRIAGDGGEDFQKVEHISRIRGIGMIIEEGEQ